MIMAYFSKKGHSIICNMPCDLVIYQQNIEETPEGNLNVFLFGSLLLTHDKKDGSIVDVKTITLGTRVIIPIYSSDQIINDDDHSIIKFEEGDTIIENDEVSANITNVYELFNNILLGRLSGQIKREKYYNIMLNVMRSNVKLNFPKLLLEIMISQTFVDEKGNLSRLSQSNVETPLGVNALVQSSNTYNSMTFEDPTKSMLINLGKSRKEQTSHESPLERYMKY